MQIFYFFTVILGKNMGINSDLRLNMSSKNSVRNKKNNFDNFTNEQEAEKESWLSSGLHRFIIAFSIMWFGIVIVYISKFFGLNNLFAMTPNEFTAFLTTTTLPLAMMWVIMAFIDRSNSFKKETQMLRESLNQVIFPDSSGNAAAKMIADAIKTQVSELKDVTRDACAQSDVIKRELTERVAEMRELAEALDKYASHTMTELNEEVGKLVENFNTIADKASSATADFRVNTLQMREDSEKLVNIVTPMVNEMVTAAERVKEVVNVNNENIAKAQEQLTQYSDSSQRSIVGMIQTWEEKGESLQKAFLRTSENCEELFRRLDSGISHIENSIKEQKQVVETQSGMIDKNSAFLDNKLGEYGRLISLEVEAMVERSGTLEQNIQTQIRNMRETTEQISTAFAQTENQIGDTMQKYESKMNNLGKQLDKHLSDLRESYEKTEKRVEEFNQKFKSVGIDTFMRASSDIINELEALSIDINAVFNKNAEDEDLWKKYYDGDHGVFVRYLSKNMTKKQVIAIKDDYENNQSFRIVVDKYLADFEALVATARENERAGTLLALISGSDIGKVYYILARALGKIG